MKTRFYFIFYLTLILSSIGLFIACSSDKDSGSNKKPYDPSKPIELTSFFPDTGKIASKVILQGSNFGNDPSLIKVYFNEKRASIVGAVNDKMYVLTPRLPGDKCIISVVVGDDSLVYDKTFEYHISHNVSTYLGKENTGGAFIGGTFADTQFSGTIGYSFFDNNDEMFLTCHAGSGVDESTAIYVSEKDNLTRDCWTAGQKRNGIHVLDVDPRTGIVYGGDRQGDVYYEMDPESLWAVRARTIQHPSLEDQAEKGYVDWNVLGFKQSVGFSKYDNMLYTRDKSGQIVKWDPTTRVGTLVMKDKIGDKGDTRILFSPKESDAHIMYFSVESGHSIYMIDMKSPNKEAVLFTGAGMGSGSHRDGALNDAEFKNPKQICFDRTGENMYVADAGNHCIRQINLESKIVTTIAGQPGKEGNKDGSPEESQFKSPQGVSINSAGEIFIVDRGNRLVRKLTIE